jgi:hypothetical protein
MNILSDSVVFTHSVNEATLSKSSRLCNALKVCSGLHLALAELLGDDSDSTAPNRLMLMNQPTWETQWVVQTKHNMDFTPPTPLLITPTSSDQMNNNNNSSSSAKKKKNSSSTSTSSFDGLPTLATTVRLEYKVPRRGSLLHTSQTLAELSDFQGSCVLAKTATGEAQVTNTPDTLYIYIYI